MFFRGRLRLGQFCPLARWHGRLVQNPRHRIETTSQRPQVIPHCISVSVAPGMLEACVFHTLLALSLMRAECSAGLKSRLLRRE
jgi:hypothetical protein